MFAVYQKAATSIPNLCEKGKISTYFPPRDVKNLCYEPMTKLDKGETQDQFYAFSETLVGLTEDSRHTMPFLLMLIQYIPEIMTRLTHETESKKNKKCIII